MKPMNNFMGWAFIIASWGFIYTGQYEMAMGWLILAKLCWVHQSILDRSLG